MSDQIERLSSCLAEGLRESLRAPKTAGATPSPEWAASLAELVQETLTARGAAGLAQALREAISLAAERVDQVSVAVTGPGWLGGGVPTVERVLSELIAGAQNEIMLTAYARGLCARILTPSRSTISQGRIRALACTRRCSWSTGGSRSSALPT